MSIREKVLQDLPRGMNELDKRNTHCFQFNTISNLVELQIIGILILSRCPVSPHTISQKGL